MSPALATHSATHPTTAPAAGPLTGPLPSVEAQEVVLATLVSSVFLQADPVHRARLLECLIGVLRPLGLVAVASGAFGNFLHRVPWERLTVSVEEAVRYSSEQVYELARFVEQVEPQALGRLAFLVADSPALLGTLTASLLLTSLKRWGPDRPGAAAPETASWPS